MPSLSPYCEVLLQRSHLLPFSETMACMMQLLSRAILDAQYVAGLPNQTSMRRA